MRRLKANGGGESKRKLFMKMSVKYPIVPNIHVNIALQNKETHVYLFES